MIILSNVTLGYASIAKENFDKIDSYWSNGKSMSEDRNELTAVVY